MSCKAKNCTNKSCYWIAHQGRDSVVCSERCGLALCPEKITSLIFKHHIYDDGTVHVHEKSPLITNVYAQYPMIASSRCVGATLEQARSQTHPGYYAVNRSTFYLLHYSLIGPEQEGKKRGREEEEESSGKRTPTLTLEDLPDDALVEMFLALEHGSQFDALRQTSKRFKRLSDRATIVRRQRAEKRNSDGTYVYKGWKYGIQTLTAPMSGKGTISWFANEKHGIETKLYENGQQEYEGNYKDGKMDGAQREWHEDGRRSTEYHYKDGQKDGVYKMWQLDEQPSVDWNYKNGKQDGVQREWYPNGRQLVYEYNYKDGNEDGVQKKWRSLGRPWSENNYKNGSKDGFQKEWYENGQEAHEGNYKDGKGDGVHKQWY